MLVTVYLYNYCRYHLLFLVFVHAKIVCVARMFCKFNFMLCFRLSSPLAFVYNSLLIVSRLSFKMIDVVMWSLWN